MNITILAIGSRGDTQPYIALGLGLQRAGHQVCICASDPFESLVTAYGLKFHPLGVDIPALLSGSLFGALYSGRNPIQALRAVVRAGVAAVQPMVASTIAASEHAEVIIANLLGLGGYTIAEQRGVPFIMALNVPLPARTGAMPNLLLSPRLSGRAWTNRLTHDLVENGLLWPFLRQAFNGWRRAFALKPFGWWGFPFESLHGRSVPRLYDYSPAVLPRPADWPDHWQVTGYWFLDRPADWQPPADLVRFIEAGSPPVYIGFGSMTARDPARTSRLIVEALRHCRQRAVVTGDLALRDLPDTLFPVASIPHDWLFPQLAAVIHHGGAGTTAAGLRAGVPTVTIPHFGDQFFWGQQLDRLGVGVHSIPRSRLTADRLAGAIRQATTDADIRRQAAVLGEKIRAEDGVSTATRLITRYLDIH